MLGFNRRNWRGMLAANGVLILGLILIGTGMVGAAVTNDVCADCHEELCEEFHKTPHGTYFSTNSQLAGASCESCHGSALAHIESGAPEDIVNPARQDQFGGEELCLSCHTGHQFDDWAFSAHNAADVTCSDCHTVHAVDGAVVSQSTPDLCYSCHSDVRAAANMPSHHPIAEGKMECQDCHGLHGAPARFVMEDTGRELCLSCHTEKEGPFVYEHAPVEEDCMICHTPHGSVANNLLVQNQPSLCLSCHPMHFHATAMSVDGDFDTPQAPERAGSSTPDSFERGMLTNCSQCHIEIHGSDLPSQEISTGGNALTR